MKISRDKDREISAEKGKGNIFWGVVLLLGAVAGLLGSMGYLGGMNFWPVLFSIILAALCVQGIVKRKIGQILFSAAFFVIVNDELLHLEAITPWPVLGAAFLGTIGLSLLFPGFGKKKFRFVISDHEVITEENRSGDRLSYENVFGKTVKYVTGEISIVDVENAFGAMEIYFSDAVLKDGSARLSVESAFGRVDLYVPSSWKVVRITETSFGSVQEEENSRFEDSNVLYVGGEVVFGVLEIHYI